MGHDWTTHPLFDWLTRTRREFHRHPELAFEEHRTTARIREELTGLGLAIQNLPDLETGVAAVLDTGRPGPCLAFRADIDALPLTEAADRDHASTIPGRMHACGHDAHATIMLGLAKKMVEGGMARRLTGKVKFIFQPAEELVAGARRMIDAGVLESPRPDRIVAGHVFPDLPVGRIGIPQVRSYAGADRIALTITGKGGHGAFPEQVIDPVVAGAAWLGQLQTVVSRTTPALDSLVVSIGSFHAGTAPNIIPETAELAGSMRWLDPAVRDAARDRIRDITAGIESGFGVRAELTLETMIPSCSNDPVVMAAMETAAGAVVGGEGLEHPRPVMGSEDFSLFTEALPGAMVILGCGPADGPPPGPLHSPTFDIDERVLPLGVELFARAAEDYLGG